MGWQKSMGRTRREKCVQDEENQEPRRTVLLAGAGCGAGVQRWLLGLAEAVGFACIQGGFGRS